MSTLGAHVLPRGEAFLNGHARLLERRLFEVAFRGADPAVAVAAVNAYRNPDGGFGCSLEPDLCAPGSQPVYMHYALSALREAGASELEGASHACDFLASCAREDGAIPYALPDAMEHDRAGHWNGPFALEPSLHATAGVIGGLLALGVEHPWLERATRYVVDEISGEPPYSGHRMLNVLDVLLHLPDRERAEALWPHVTGRLFEADNVYVDTPVVSYGLTPLHFAPTPDARVRPLFADDLIEAHLDDLLGRQQDDGGWPLTWTPPAGSAEAAWRGRWTLDALRTLRAYGRLPLLH